MATEYALPQELLDTIPQYDHVGDIRELLAREDAWVQSVVSYLRRRLPNNPLIGTEMAFGVADGHARYLVCSTKPLGLVHLPLGDAYRVPVAHIRGLRLSDVRAVANRAQYRRTLRPMFR